MNVPKLRFKDDNGQDFPEWEEKTLGDILTFKNGVNASREQYGSGYKFINVLDIINNQYISYENIIGSVSISEAEFIKNEVKYGDILFQRSSETREEVGQSNVYLGHEPVTFGGFVIRGRGIIEYNPYFLHNALKIASVRDDITQRSGGSTRFNIGQESLSAVSVYVPTLPEQTKIANFLSAVDDKIAELTEKVALLQRYKKGAMQQIFSQQLRFKDDNGQDFPEWEEKILGEIGTFFSGGTPLTSRKEFYNGTIPFIKSGELGLVSTAQTITELGLKNSSAKMVNAGDLLYALYGATSGELAISKIAGAINQAILCIRTNLNTVFLSFYLLFKKQSILKTYLQGGQGNLSAEIIKSLTIPCPCEKEQTKIANFLSALDEQINTSQQQLDLSKQYKQSLLQQMFI